MWVVNNAWAHSYFTYLNTGRRIYEHQRLVSIDGSGPMGVAYSGQGYTVTQRVYTYTIPAAGGGADYVYAAVEYLLTQPDGKRLLLRSRGCGLGTATAYLDIDLANPSGAGVTAFRGDPVMYTYTVNLEQSVLITDEIGGAVASLPTVAPRERARYWLDVNNGTDLGGYTYALRAQAIDCQTRNLDSAFVTGFRLMYFEDLDGVVKEIKRLPRLLSETRANKPIYLPLLPLC
ncbi:MAG TPA: hypothetical protein DCL15_22020 [Chloroflexi bacterium]|nr:hypothetical protein [Chloroflexota bacterium]HHW85022.1 hypothetical protein [Chloroflexota bacterium]